MISGQKIKLYRKLAKISQAELAKQVGVSRSAIAGYENGHATPSIEVICKLSEALNVGIDLLMDEYYQKYINKPGTPIPLDKLKQLRSKYEESKTAPDVKYLVSELVSKIGYAISLNWDGKKLNEHEKQIVTQVLESTNDTLETIFSKKQ